MLGFVLGMGLIIPGNFGVPEASFLLLIPPGRDTRNWVGTADPKGCPRPQGVVLSTGMRKKEDLGRVWDAVCYLCHPRGG